MPRTCAVCQADISWRHILAKYCGTPCRSKAYWENNKERLREHKAMSYQRDKEHIQEKRRQWRRDNREDINRRGKLQRAAAIGIDLNDRRCAVCDGDISHRTLKAEYCESCYKERVNERRVASYHRNKEHTQAKNKEWYQNNKDKIRVTIP